MAQPRHYNIAYKKMIEDQSNINKYDMVRGKFYLIKEYKYVDGTIEKYTPNNAPIIFTLFCSKPKDIIHAVKVSDVRPEIIKKFFGKFVNEDTHKIEMKGGAKQIYSKIVGRIPVITDDAYRTYIWQNIKKVALLDMEVKKLTPKEKPAKGVKVDKQNQNR
jgi:hypothetical protein